MPPGANQRNRRQAASAPGQQGPGWRHHFSRPATGRASQVVRGRLRAFPLLPRVFVPAGNAVRLCPAVADVNCPAGKSDLAPILAGYAGHRSRSFYARGSASRCCRCRTSSTRQAEGRMAGNMWDRVRVAALGGMGALAALGMAACGGGGSQPGGAPSAAAAGSAGAIQAVQSAYRSTTGEKTAAFRFSETINAASSAGSSANMAVTGTGRWRARCRQRPGRRRPRQSASRRRRSGPACRSWCGWTRITWSGRSVIRSPSRRPAMPPAAGPAVAPPPRR